MDEQDYRCKSLYGFQRAALVMVVKQLKRSEDQRWQAVDIINFFKDWLESGDRNLRRRSSDW